MINESFFVDKYKIIGILDVEIFSKVKFESHLMNKDNLISKKRTEQNQAVPHAETINCLVKNTCLSTVILFR